MLEWTRPAGFAALVLPALVLLVSLRPERPRSLASGAFALWRGLAGAATGRRRRRRVPLERWLLVASLVAASVALAGPRRRGSAAPPVWEVVVDRSPSMYLASAGGGTRLDAALARLARERARCTPQPRLVWREAGASAASALDELPDAWRRPPDPARPEPVWERHDRPGRMWLTDRVPDTARRAAGLCAVGGAAVPGPVGSAGRSRFDWDGERLVRVDGGADERTLVLDARLPEPLAAFGRLWAEERGFALGGADARPRALALEVACAGEPRPARLDGEGWRLRGEAGSLAAPELAPWSAGTRAPGAALVAQGPGRVAVAFVTCEEPEGDPAAFALDWAALLDGACLPAPGAVALAERAEAGAGGFEPPQPARPTPDAEPLPPPALAAGVATALALAALVATRPRRAREPRRYAGVVSPGRRSA